MGWFAVPVSSDRAATIDGIDWWSLLIASPPVGGGATANGYYEVIGSNVTPAPQRYRNRFIESWDYLTFYERNSIMKDAMNEADVTLAEPDPSSDECFYCAKTGLTCVPDSIHEVYTLVATYISADEARELLVKHYGYIKEDITEGRVMNVMRLPQWTTELRTACDNHTTWCEWCEEPFVTANPHLDVLNVPSYTSAVSTSWQYDDRLCRECSDNAASCGSCGEVASRDSMSLYNHNNLWCESCIDECCCYCDHCNTYQYYEHVCPYAPDSSDRGNCIESYSYRPRPVFKWLEEVDGDLSVSKALRDSTPFMGFELEVEVGNASVRTPQLLNTLDEAFNGTAYYKHDGSLNNGFEIVTHPMTLAAHKEVIDWSFCQKLTSVGVRSWQPGTCGLHVHISRSSFRSLTHLALFQFLILHNKAQFQYFAGRDGSEWANFDGVSKNVIPEMKGKPYYNRGRYEAVNVTNSSTVEIRIFRGSLKPERVKMALELVNACWVYTSTMGSNAYINGSCNFARFAEFVAGKEEYENLNGYIAAMPERIRMAK